MDTPREKDEAKRRREIEDVMREKISRRRPIDMDTIREAIKLREDYWRLLRSKDETAFWDFLSALGWKPGSREFEHFVRLWRAMQR
jgi:hypothetical protein